MAISVNWITGEITVPKADTQLVSAGPPEIRSHDTDAFRLELKDLEDDAAGGRPWPRTHNHNLPVTIAGITYARTLEIIAPYFVTYEDGQYRVSLGGSNNNIVDVATVNQVSIISNNSAGLTFSEEINSQSFTSGQVTLDVNAGLPGTAFPRGTPTNPVNNLSDALQIAADRGLHKIALTGFVTATGSENLDGISIEGGAGASNVVYLAGVSTVNSSFERLIVCGAQNGLSRFVDVILGVTGLAGFTNAEGRFINCIVNTASGFEQNATGVGSLLDNCSFVMPDNAQVAFNANGKAFSLRQCTGNILITNATDVEEQDLNFAGGRVEVDASCTAGQFNLSGVASLTDNSGGTVLSQDSFISPDDVRLARDHARAANLQTQQV
jgi:hypothetical protein